MNDQRTCERRRADVDQMKRATARSRSVFSVQVRGVAWAVCLVISLACASSAVAQEAPVEKPDGNPSSASTERNGKPKKKNGKDDKALSADELEYLIQELSGKLKQVKERDAEVKREKVEKLKAEIEELQEKVRQSQQELQTLNPANPANGTGGSMMNPNFNSTGAMPQGKRKGNSVMSRADSLAGSAGVAGRRGTSMNAPMPPSVPSSMYPSARRDSMSRSSGGGMPSMQSMSPMTAPKPMRTERQALMPQSIDSARGMQGNQPQRIRYREQGQGNSQSQSMPSGNRATPMPSGAVWPQATGISNGASSTASDASSRQGWSETARTRQGTNGMGFERRLNTSQIGAAQLMSAEETLSQDTLNTYSMLGEGKSIAAVGYTATNGTTTGSAYRNGFGMTYIDSKPYYTLNLAPEIALGNFAAGLDATVRIGEDGKFRIEDWKNLDAALRAVRYVRYASGLNGVFGDGSNGTGGVGQESSVFVRLGQLDNVTLGTGALMQNYRNNASYDARKVGAEMKVAVRNWTVEAMASNIARAEIFGGRVALKDTEVLGGGNSATNRSGGNGDKKEVEVGVTLIADMSRTARLLAPTDEVRILPVDSGLSYVHSESSFGFQEASAVQSGAVGVFGVDAKVEMVHEPLYSVIASVEYSQLLQKTVGTGTGGSADLALTIRNEKRDVEATLSFRHLISGSGYRPAYFNAFYELERYRVVGTDLFGNAVIQTKGNEVSGAGAAANSFYISGKIGHEEREEGSKPLAASEERKRVWAEASYLDAYNGSGEALFYAGLGLAGYIERVSGYVRYYKLAPRGTGLFVLDERAQLRAEITLRVSELVVIGTSVDWTFKPVYGEDGRTVIRYLPEQRIEPKFNFSLKF